MKRIRQIGATKMINPARFTNVIFVFAIVILVLIFSIKGSKFGPSYYQNVLSTAVAGPFESSSSTSRYALTQAIVDNGTFLLTKTQAKFSSPDVVNANGKFLSIFTPGISFIGVPFYWLGEIVGLQQIFAYLSVTLCGIIDMFLIAYIATRLGAKLYSGLLAGFLFLFGTNAFVYALSYAQHITSVMFLLLSILMVLGEKRVWKTVLFGAFAGISILLDIPNAILLTPVGIYLLLRYVSIEQKAKKVKLSINLTIITLLIGLIPFALAFAAYNYSTTGSFTTIGQTVGRAAPNLTAQKTTKVTTSSTEVLPFKPRAQIVGLYTLLVSNERSWLFYSPVVLLGSIGFALLYKNRKYFGIGNVLLAIVVVDIVLYSMFGDPWGGWAFGPRYLIPAAAIMCILLALAIEKFKKRLWFLIIFGLTAFYSIAVSSLGALTTSDIPPKIEAIHLASPIPYTYLYNIDLINQNILSPLVYNFLFPEMDAWIYIVCVIAVLFFVAGMLYELTVISERRE